MLTDAALAGCGTSNVYLSAWYTNVPDKSAINVDSMGGYQFAYWVDDAGNACHGDPGRNGQVGPVIIKAFRQQAFDLAINGSSTTEEQLKAFQEIPTSFANYSASGSHFVQFINTLFRSRSDGKAFRDSSGTISIPTVIEIGSKACTAPVAFRVTGTSFLPSPPAPGPAQDPHRCSVRAMPATATMSEEDRKKYDVLTLPYGTNPVSVP